MTKPAWKEKPSWFLVAERDRMIAPETQRFMAHRTGGHILAMEMDHTPTLHLPLRRIGSSRSSQRQSMLSCMRPFHTRSESGGAHENRLC
jgi:hypothetical protein